MKTLVVGGTGTVGSEVAESLSLAGVAVRCLTRHPEKLVSLPKSRDCRVGDLNDPASLPACFEGCESAFIVLALSQNEEEQGRNAVRAARDAGMKKLVFMSVFQPPGTDHIPHMAGKRPVEDAVRQSGIPYVILRPNSFFQNELRSRVPLWEFSVFNTPFGHIGANRIDVRDVAAAATRALTSNDFDNGIYALHGPESLTGPSMADVWTLHLGKTVTYTGDDIDMWEKSVAPHLPPWLTRNLRLMYEYLRESGFVAAPEEVATSVQLVGHELRTYDAFVREVVAQWSST